MKPPHTSSGQRGILLVALFALAGLCPPAVAAQDAPPPATLPAVKAAFVYNFIKLVTWPEARLAAGEAPIAVCLVDGEAMDEALRLALDGKSVEGHPVRVERLAAAGDELAGCHVLYLDAAHQSRYPALMAKAAGKGVLVVDEGSNFTWPDGMIRLFADQGRVRFELNLQAVERAGLKIDPRLIRLARIATR